MTRRALRFQLSQVDASESPLAKTKAGKCGGARNHHITEFFKPSSKPDALISALKETVNSDSLQLRSQDDETWNKTSNTFQGSRKILVPSANVNLSLSGNKKDKTIVRKFEKFCPKCGRSLLSPRVLLKRLVLPVNSKVYLDDKGGCKIFSGDLKAVHAFSADTGLHASSITCGARSRGKGALTVLGRTLSCNHRHFDNIPQTTMCRQSNCSPLKSLNLLTSDLQASLDMRQDELTRKNLVVNLGTTGSNQFGQQVEDVISSPSVVETACLASPALSDCPPLSDCSEEDRVKTMRRQTPKRALWKAFDSDESFTGVSLSSSDEEEREETFKPLDEIFSMASKAVAATPQNHNLDRSFVSSSQSSFGTPVTKTFQSNLQTPLLYVNDLDRLVKEHEECKRIDEMEKLLHEDLERGLGVSNREQNAEDGELTDEHRDFLEKFKLVTNAIPDQHPGEEIFNLLESGTIFSLRSLDLKHSDFSDGNSEESIIFSCSQENQITLATQGFFTFLYRFRKCPDFLMRWMFQMVSIHPSYAVSVKLLHTLIEISCNNLSYLQEKPWTPSLLDIATVFANMGIHFDTLFPLPNIRPSFSSIDFGSALPLAGLLESGRSEPIFSHVPEFQIAHVIKFLGFCSAICRESFCDLEILALIVLLLKLHLEKDLKDFPPMDLHCLIETLLQNIKSWETVMPEMFYAISELSTHHHNYIKLLQLIPTSEDRGRQLRKHLSLIFMSNILYGTCKFVPLDYDSQMLLLCQLMSEMRPSSLVKKMQQCPENESKTLLSLDQEAYYLTFSLLHLVNDASSSDEPPSIQRKYLLKLCTELEKHIKSDIREGARYFYRTKVKDLVARIHGRWQELLLYSRPNQGKLHDYWEPVCDSSSPHSPQENIDDPQDFLYDDN